MALNPVVWPDAIFSAFLTIFWSVIRLSLYPIQGMDSYYLTRSILLDTTWLSTFILYKYIPALAFEASQTTS